MEKIYELLEKANAFSEKVIGPIIDKIVQFISSGEYTAIGIIGVFISLVFLIGILTWIKKTPKLFFLVLLVFGALVAAALLLKGS
ncbi:MAG TPA: hypothetical protein GX692_04375 [Acholeplasmataceae bacterium]|jgi:hypothetical protein|nr:hypothetical protein [Acholeplasmataceae bacterium]